MWAKRPTTHLSVDDLVWVLISVPYIPLSKFLSIKHSQDTMIVPASSVTGLLGCLNSVHLERQGKRQWCSPSVFNNSSLSYPLVLSPYKGLVEVPQDYWNVSFYLMRQSSNFLVLYLWFIRNIRSAVWPRDAEPGFLCNKSIHQRQELRACCWPVWSTWVKAAVLVWGHSL